MWVVWIERVLAGQRIGSDVDPDVCETGRRLVDVWTATAVSLLFHIRSTLSTVASPGMGCVVPKRLGIGRLEEVHEEPTCG